MKTNKKEVCQYLLTQKKWITSTELGAHFHVSARQIRNLIRQLLEDDIPVETSRKGYRLIEINESYLQEKILSRPFHILQLLLSNNDGITIDALLDTLYISCSTLENELKDVRHILQQYDLKLSRRKDTYHIKGEEAQKRNLISYILREHTGFSDMVQALHLEIPYSWNELKKRLFTLFHEQNIYLNDMALNTVLLHLLIALDRNHNGSRVSCDIQLPEPLQRCESILQDFIKDHFYTTLHIMEIHSLLFIVSCNCNLTDFHQLKVSNLSSYIKDDCIDMAKTVLTRTAEQFTLTIHEEDFLPNFTLHLQNLLMRMEQHYHATNPMKEKIKNDYPLIYEISVFMAQQIQVIANISVNEDEITYLALHIGAYFENNEYEDEHISCAFLYIDYYQYYKKLLQKLMVHFPNLNIKYAIPVWEYNPRLVHCDFIISLSDEVRSANCPVICISTFLSNMDKNHIQAEIDKAALHKKINAFQSECQLFFDKHLFYRNLYCESVTDMIITLGNDAISLGYGSQELIEDILHREHISSTSFPNSVALPHAMKHIAKRSFIAIVINDQPFVWGKHQVQLIAMIGISEHDRKQFRPIFNYFTDITFDRKNVQKLLKCQTYDEFVNCFIHLADQDTSEHI